MNKYEKVKFNYNKLRGRIKERFGTEKTFAKELGLTASALSSRLTNKTEFTPTEIFKSSILLNFDSSCIGEYFFNPEVQKQEQNAYIIKKRW